MSFGKLWIQHKSLFAVVERFLIFGKFNEGYCPISVDTLRFLNIKTGGVERNSLQGIIGFQSVIALIF